ncbi:hypothetical protein QTP88_024053 [Uroleucon formosanum]
MNSRDNAGFDDKRLVYVYSFLVKSLKIKNDVIDTMMRNRDYQALVMDFLTMPDRNSIFFALNSAGLLTPMYDDFPDGYKSKVSYIIRLQPIEVTHDNCDSILLCGEVSLNPFEDLKAITENVLLNLFSTKENFFKNCSDDIIVEVQDRFNDFLTNINNMSGQMKNRSILTLPYGYDNITNALKTTEMSDGKIIDDVLKQRLENKVYTWFKEMKIMVTLKPEVILEKDPAASPSQYLAFWKNREQQFIHFHEQIDKQIGHFLTITKSPCMDIYKQIIETTVTEKQEMNLINMFLSTLTKHINTIERVGLVESKEDICILWRKLALIWINCPNFQNYNYIIVLIKVLCNMVMAESSRYLEPTALFQGELAENLTKIYDILDILSYFKNQFKVTQTEYFQEQFDKFILTNSVPRNYKPRYWKFHINDLFQNLDAFEDRLNCIKSMIIKFIDYQKLEKVEVGGLMGCWYSPMIENVYLRFTKYMEKLVSIAYDPLDLLSDVNNALFVEDYNFYLNMSEDIDNRLATVSKACFENIEETMSFHKFLMIFGSAVLNRPIVAAVVEKYYEKVLDLLDQDLAREFKIIDRLSGTAMATEIEKSDHYEMRFIPEEMDLEYPLVARAMIWGNSRINNRLLEDLNTIRSFYLPILKTPRGDKINIKIEQLKDKFKNYLNPLFEEWKGVVPLQIQEKIEQPLFTINKNNTINLNFSKELDAAIKVTRYIIHCNYNFKDPISTIGIDDIPYDAIKLCKREKLILTYKRDIEEIVKWYNMLRTETHPTELQLIIQEIENIDSLIDDAQKYVTWNSEDIVYLSENDLNGETQNYKNKLPISLQNTISTIHSLTENVYERVMQTHENFQKIITLSSQWTNKPMYVRDKNTRRIIFGNKLTEKKIGRYAEVRDASTKIQQLLMEDLLLFHNVPLFDPNLSKFTSTHLSLKYLCHQLSLFLNRYTYIKLCFINNVPSRDASK